MARGGRGCGRRRHAGGHQRPQGFAPLAISKRYFQSAVVSWLEPFLLRRVLIAHWGVGRDRRRARLPGLGEAAEAVVWRELPRQAMAEVLLLMAPAAKE